MGKAENIKTDKQYYKFCAYGFLKNLQFFEAFLILSLMEKGLSFTAIGVLYAVREVTTNILEIPSGIAADVLGRKKSLAASFIAYIISFILFYFFSSYSLLMLAFLFYGVGEAFRSGTHKGMIAEYLRANNIKEQMVNYYGHTRAWSQRGLALSSIAAGFIVFYSGNYNNIFLFSIFPFLVNFFLILSYPNALDKSIAGKPESKKTQLREVLATSWKMLKTGKTLRLINNSALHTAYLKAMKDYIQPMMVSLVILLPLFSEKTKEQRSALLIGLIYFFIFLLTSLASQNSSRLEKSGLKNIPLVTLAAGLSAGLLSGVFYTAHLPYLAIIFFIFIYINENIRKPVLTGYVSDSVDNSVLTSVLSIQSQLKTVLTAAIAMTFGVIADFSGIGPALAVISGGFLLITIIANIISGPVKK
ncbi:MAG: MFS transporter [Spirochaetales bacterium]|nr:MFS transporter [Spirochaetales bacterium]